MGFELTAYESDVMPTVPICPSY